jgi:hypothetical protein
MSDEPQNGQPPANQEDYAGYQNLEDLRRGYRASSDEGKRQKQRADQLEQRLTVIEQQMVANRPAAQDPLAEYGIPSQLIDQRIDQRAEQKAQEIIGRTLEPIIRGGQARNRVIQREPDYAKYEAEIANFIESDEQMHQAYQRAFTADPEVAIEWAMGRFTDHQRQQKNGRRAPKTEQGMSEAQIPSSRSGDARRVPDGEQQLREMKEQFRQEPSDQLARQIVKARLAQSIPDSFLHQ